MDDKMKKLFILLGVVGVVIVFIIVIMMMNRGPVILTYKEAEEKIKEVAKEYYDENSSLLPKVGDEREISVDDLVKLELMYPLNEIIENGDNCTGKVTVKNIENKYYYVPYIKCGDNYETSELSKKIINDNPIVESGNGIYLKNNNYVFRGENVNNYVKFSSKKWRIISIDEVGNIKLILDDVLENSVVWDDRYNSEKDYTSGLNDYTVSRIKDELDKLYESNDLFDEESKSLIVPKNICISGIGIEDKIASFECSKYAENVYVSLLNVDEYLNASIDSNCINVDDRQCQNYNYLKSNNDYKAWWTITPNKENTFEVFYVESYGTIDVKTASNSAYLKPVIYISKDVMYDSGDGTLDNPYIIK